MRSACALTSIPLMPLVSKGVGLTEDDGRAGKDDTVLLILDNINFLCSVIFFFEARCLDHGSCRFEISPIDRCASRSWEWVCPSLKTTETGCMHF